MRWVMTAIVGAALVGCGEYWYRYGPGVQPEPLTPVYADYR